MSSKKWLVLQKSYNYVNSVFWVFNGYNWATGDAPPEDPKYWTLQGSSDNISWTTLHTVTNYNATPARYAWVGIFSY